MQGDNVGQVVRWEATREGLWLRLWIDTPEGAYVTTAVVAIAAERLEDMYQDTVNAEELWAQRQLF